MLYEQSQRCTFYIRRLETTTSSILNPFRTAAPFWGQTTLLEPQSRFGGIALRLQVFCPQNGTAVLKGLTRRHETHRETMNGFRFRRASQFSVWIDGWHGILYLVYEMRAVYVPGTLFTASAVNCKIRRCIWTLVRTSLPPELWKVCTNTGRCIAYSSRYSCTGVVNPFRTAVPFWGQTTWNLTGLSPKRDCGSKRVNPFRTGVPFWGQTT